MNERDTLKINNEGHLEIGGMDTVALAEAFGTPLYVYDEVYIRNMMRTYKNTIIKEYSGNGLVLYASKAFSCMAMYTIAKDEGIGIDVVSGGEIYTAAKSGFPFDRVYMHGNNKTYAELEYALDCKVGTIVVDSLGEVETLNEIAGERGIKQAVLIRINPGIEAHTHAFVQTARTDSKFGFSISGGAAEEMTKQVLAKENLILKGYHCHIGSQIFEKQSFVLAAAKVMSFIAEIRNKTGFEATEVNMGGGFGVWYTDEDASLNAADYAEYLKALIFTIKDKCQEYGLKEPFLLIEPGRSIVAEAGITLYRVGRIKEIPGIRKYIAIDGGMFENPRYALYQSKYTALLANRAKEPCTEKVSIAGKCCESGDLIAVDVSMPEAREGDILAVLTTGAYHYSMASNYNRNLVPPSVIVKDGRADYIIKPQTYEDLIRNDLIPERLK